MKQFNFLYSLILLTGLSCSDHTTEKSNQKVVDSAHVVSKVIIDSARLIKFNWKEILDTGKFSIRYVQLNFLSYPTDSTVGHDISEYSDTLINKSFILSNKQELELFKLISEESNFSEDECGTFYLNAGFLIFDRENLCATISIGCGYNQWNFSSANSSSKYGSFNEVGFTKMQHLLDAINLRYGQK